MKLNRTFGRRDWIAAAAGTFLTSRVRAAGSLLPLKNSGLDHLSITVPDAPAAAAFYGRIFDPQVFHERMGIQRYYTRIGSAYIAFGPRAGVTPFIDHIAAGVIGFVEADFGNAETKAEVAAAGLSAAGGGLPMLTDPDGLRLQLVSATHGLFDTLMPGGRVTTDPAALTPIGLDHIMLSVPDVEKSAAYYRKLFGMEVAREKNPQRVWFKLADTRIGLERGEKPSFSRFCVKVARMNDAAARLAKLGVETEKGGTKGSLRFRDPNKIVVEVKEPQA